MSETYAAVIVVATFNCLNCKGLQRINQEGNKTLKVPTSCPNGCNVSDKGFRLNMVQSDFADAETGEYYGEVDSKKKEKQKKELSIPNVLSNQLDNMNRYLLKKGKNNKVKTDGI